MLLRLIGKQTKGRLLRVSLRTLRILSRDKKVLSPFVTDGALLTVARLAGLITCNEAEDEPGDRDADFYDSVVASLAEAKLLQSRTDADDDIDDEGDLRAGEPSEECPTFDEDAKSDISNANSGDLDSISWMGSHRTSMNDSHRGSIHQRMLERGRRDRRESKMDVDEGEGDEGDEDSGEEVQRKEAMKVLCNVVYNSMWAQERFSALG